MRLRIPEEELISYFRDPQKKYWAFYELEIELLYFET